jgi:EpsI family protein
MHATAQAGIPPAFAALPTPPSWVRSDRHDEDWRPVFSGVTTERLDAYHKDGQSVGVYVGFYAAQRQGQELVNDLNTVYQPQRWRVNAERRVAVGGKEPGPKEVQETELSSAAGILRLVWHWYAINGENTAEPWLAKLLHLRGVLSGKSTGAIIAVSTEYVTDPADTRPLLKNFTALPVTQILADSRAEP